jgi:hypothetical protein
MSDSVTIILAILVLISVFVAHFLLFSFMVVDKFKSCVFALSVVFTVVLASILINI